MLSMNILMYRGFLSKASGHHEESLDLFLQTKGLLEQNKHKTELEEVEKDLKAQIQELEKIILIKNSFSTKCKDGMGYVKTPQGMATTLVVVGAIGYLSYSIFKARK